MPLKQIGPINNPLVRRIQRHAGLRVLFRSAAPGAQRLPLAASQVDSGLPVVHANWPVVQTASAFPVQPAVPTIPATGDAAPSPVVQRSPWSAPLEQPGMTPLAVEPAALVAAAPPVQTKPAASPAKPVTPAAQPTAGPTVPAAGPTAPVLPTAAPEQTPEEEADWQRLQTIFRKHQERITAEEAAGIVKQEPPKAAASGARASIQRTLERLSGVRPKLPPDAPPPPRRRPEIVYVDKEGDKGPVAKDVSPVTASSVQETTARTAVEPDTPVVQTKAEPTTSKIETPGVQQTAGSTTVPSDSAAIQEQAEPAVTQPDIPAVQTKAEPTRSKTETPVVQPTTEQPAAQPAIPGIQTKAEPTASKTEAPPIQQTAQPATAQGDTPTVQTEAEPTASKTETPPVQQVTEAASDQSDTLAVETKAEPTASKTETPSIQQTAQPATAQSDTPTVQTRAEPTASKTETPSIQQTPKPAAAQSDAPTIQKISEATAVQPDTPTVRQAPETAAAQPATPGAQPTGEPGVEPALLESDAATVQRTAGPAADLPDTPAKRTVVEFEPGATEPVQQAGTLALPAFPVQRATAVNPATPLVKATAPQTIATTPPVTVPGQEDESKRPAPPASPLPTAAPPAMSGLVAAGQETVGLARRAELYPDTVAESPAPDTVARSATAEPGSAVQSPVPPQATVPIVQTEPSTESPFSQPATEAATAEPKPARPPLEEVWPVQRRQMEPAVTPPMPAVMDSGKPAVQRKPASADPTAGDVHQALQAVAPGQSTDSAIELIMPRRPRPTPPVQRSSAADEASPEAPVGQVTELPVTLPSGPSLQRSGTPPSLIAAAAARAEAAPTAAAPAGPTAQRQPDQSPVMIPTEIGELPSDLWTLIGQQPPSVPGRDSDRQVEPTNAGAVSPASRPDVQRAIAAAEAPASPPEVTPAPQPSGPLVPPLPAISLPIQRAVASTSAPSVQRQTGDEAPGPEGEGIDITQLSEQVYSEVRRRLAVEWERGRGRL